MITRSVPYSLRYISYGFLFLFILLIAVLLFCAQPVYAQTCQLQTHADPSKSTQSFFDCVDKSEFVDSGILSFKYTYDGRHKYQDNYKTPAIPTPPEQPELNYYLDKYNANYDYYNNQVWFHYLKKVVPFGFSFHLYGLFQTVSLLSLNQLEMLAVSSTIGAAFNLGEDASLEFSRLYGTSPSTAIGTSTSPVTQPNARGRLAGGLTMMAVDMGLETFLNHKIPDIEALTFSETLSKFTKSVAITGQLTKSLINLTEKKCLDVGYEQDSCEAFAQGSAAATLGALISLGALTGLTSKKVTDGIKAAQLKSVTDKVATTYLEELKKADYKYPEMTASQKASRYAREQIPHAATVTTAYTTKGLLVSTCKKLVKELDLGENAMKYRDPLCLAVVSSISLTAAWLGLNSDKWVTGDFSGVFIDNIHESDGMHLTDAAKIAAESYVESPMAKDLLKMGAGTLSFSVFYAINRALPNNPVAMNARNGAHLSLILDGTQIVMSHSIPFAIIAPELAYDIAYQTLYSLSYPSHVLSDKDNKQLNLQSDLDNGNYKIPILNRCIMTNAVGQTTESYQMNHNCY
ncbi:hypothetical protein [Endozoicomonas lisbonensis]|uniref:DUF637 domain-containing protein n=1 Tax=Endozoicomonas lisbonensis TaxID=3120522 RepID=A0ABV2SP10_9GAMM